MLYTTPKGRLQHSHNSIHSGKSPSLGPGQKWPKVHWALGLQWEGPPCVSGRDTSFDAFQHRGLRGLRLHPASFPEVSQP